MEGDAGSGQLNPADADEPSPSEVKAADSSESGAGTDQTGAQVKAADSSESGAGTDQTGAQVKAADSLESPAQTASEPGEDADPQPDPEPATARGPSRLRRGWLVGIAAALLVLAGGVGAGGYLALRSHLDSTAIARANVAATEAAKDCVAATQAPDAAAMAASMKKIIDCSTGDFGAQASLYTGMLVEAYQTANVHVKVTDMRAAVERNNSDRSVDVLVAFRVNVSNTDANAQEVGYRLRVRMAPDDGRYKIARLDQVTK